MGSTGINAGPIAPNGVQGGLVDVKLGRGNEEARRSAERRANSRARRAVNNALDATALSLGTRYTDDERTKIVNDVLGNPRAANISGYKQLEQWAKEHGGKRRFSNLK